MAVSNKIKNAKAQKGLQHESMMMSQDVEQSVHYSASTNILDAKMGTPASSATANSDVNNSISAVALIDVDHLLQSLDESAASEAETYSQQQGIPKHTARFKQFLALLLRMASQVHPELFAAIQLLIQDLVDSKLDSEEFVDNLQGELCFSHLNKRRILPLINVMLFLKSYLNSLRNVA